MNNILMKLSPDLHSIYELELSLGNSVARIDEPAGSTCPYAVVFKLPLHKAEIDARLNLEPEVSYSEEDDPHYPAEMIYQSAQTRHVVSGPLK